MRWSRSYIPTLKEAPADAEVISHKLLVRAGLIRKLTSGIYTFLPLGMRALNKSAQIVREEMDRAGAQEVFMPMVQPGDLWKETGRWDFYGKELLRLQDRHGRDYCLGPTHEEVITDLVRGEIKSYRQLPVNLYQIQTKFRDEIRPRFGLMRGREFMMKDAYSFDRDDDGADKSYWSMYEAYSKAFTRFGMRFRAVEADSGAIGGSFSHEFMVLADTGEDTIVVCKDCEYAANVEKAPVAGPANTSPEACPSLETVETPGAHTVDEVAKYLKVDPAQIVKTLLFDVDGKPVAAMVRGDRELNDVKLGNFLAADGEVVMASPEQVTEWTGAPVGFAGPVGLPEDVRLVADLELSGGNDYVAGANKGDAHILHLDLSRDVQDMEFADLRMITEDDPCPRCSGKVELTKGIEVGHVFKLGTKYSKSMDATYLDENGKSQLMIMGCYGIGVSRIIAACIEQNHDEYGIIFPPPLAPFEVVVINLSHKDEEATAKAETIYESIRSMGLDVLIDDRPERPGVKFNEADLVGFPMQVVVGAKALARGVVEVKNRKTGEKGELAVDDFEAAFKAWHADVLKSWDYS